VNLHKQYLLTKAEYNGLECLYIIVFTYFSPPAFMQSSPSHCASHFHRQDPGSITITHGVEETFPEEQSHGYITTTADAKEMSVQKCIFLF
jgi:hypothetical protein